MSAFIVFLRGSLTFQDPPFTFSMDCIEDKVEKQIADNATAGLRTSVIRLHCWSCKSSKGVRQIVNNTSLTCIRWDAQVSVRLQPVDPTPMDVRVQVEYTTDDGHTYMEELPELRVGTADFVLPLPMHDIQHRLPTAKTPFDVFFALWRHIETYGRVDNATCKQRNVPEPTTLNVGTDGKPTTNGDGVVHDASHTRSDRVSHKNGSGASHVGMGQAEGPEGPEGAPQNETENATHSATPATTMLRTTLRFYNVDMQVCPCHRSLSCASQLWRPTARMACGLSVLVFGVAASVYLSHSVCVCVRARTQVCVCL